MQPDVVSQWPLVSRLLDEAMALPANAREAWLENLPAEHASLKPVLARLLSRETQAADFFAGLPADDGDDSKTVAPRTNAHEAASTHAPGMIVGPFRLVRELGHGGMGTVWLAERTDAAVKLPIALKLPSLDAHRSHIEERFEREREILAALNHPNIARLYEAGVTADGQPYLALEYVEGESLPDYCNRRALPARKRLELFLQVLRAVAYAHANLVIHRDLKPSNLIVSATGEVKLLDFGIAKLLERGASSTPGTELTELHGRIMTLEYASPEQVRGEALTTATDVYSLGVVLFELLTGTRPYRLKRGSRAELEEAILAGETTRPSQSVAAPFAAMLAVPASRWRRTLRGDLDTIVSKALEKEPQARYLSVEAFAQDCERMMQGRPVLAVPPSALYRFRRFVGRHRLGFIAASVAALALIAGSVVALWQARIALEQSRVAQAQTRVAEQEARKQRAVQSFLTSLFDRNTRLQPDAAKARNMTVRELLVEAADRVEHSFDDTPAVKLELLNTVAGLLRDIDDYERALVLSERAVALARERALTSSDAYVEGLMGVAVASRLLGRGEQAIAARDESLRVLDERGDRTSLLRARASANTVAQFSPDKDREIALVEEALKLFESRYPEDPLHFVSLFYLGNLHRTQQHPEQAADYFRRAIEVFDRVGSRDYTNLGASHGFLGACEQYLGQPTAGLASYRTGLEILDRHAGASSLVTRFQRTHYAEALLQTGHVEEANAAFDLVRRSAPPGGPTVVDFDADLYAADGLIEQGRPREAQAMLERYSGNWVQFGRRFAPNGRRWVLALAFAQAMQGRDREARHTLERMRELPGAFYGEDFENSPERLSEVAWIALAGGDADDASQSIAKASGFLRTPPERFTSSYVRLATHAAEIAARRGEAESALEHAERALAHLRTRAERDGFPFLEARALKARGEALLAAGRAAEAIETLEEARRIMRRVHAPDSPWLIEATAVLSLAHGRMGDRVQARALETEARTLARRHPALAAYFLARLASQA